MVTRSKESKELVRGDQELDDRALDLSVMSVESANNSGSNCSNVVDLNSSELEPRQVVNISHISNHGNEPVGEVILSPLLAVPEHPDSDSEYSDAESASDTDVLPNSETLCPASHCHYGNSNGDPKIPVYKCLACCSKESIEEGLSSGPVFVCDGCYKAGGHKNHKRYMTFGIKKFSDW